MKRTASELDLRKTKITVVKNTDISNTQISIWKSALSKLGIELSITHSDDVSHVIAGPKCTALQVVLMMYHFVRVSL